MNLTSNKSSKLSLKRLSRHILFWLAVLAFFTLFELLISGNDFWKSLKFNSMFLLQDIILVYIILYALIPIFYEKKHYFLFILSLLGIMLLNVILSFVSDYFILQIGIEVEEKVFARKVLTSILTFTFIAGLATFIKLVQINNKVLVNKENAEARSHKAELALLRSQINPHFLFNVFNNIDELIYIDRDKASETLSFLSDSLRYVLKGSDEDTVPIAEEIDFIRSYLKVASISFSDPDFIKLSISVSDGVINIAPLIFIPFIENAVKHCNRKSGAPGIEVEINCSDDTISLICVNSIKPKMKEEITKGGFGLNNAYKRLDMIYKNRYSLNIKVEEDLYKVDLKIY